MMTVIVGLKSDDNVCHIHTLAENVPDPKYVSFNLPTQDSPLQPGSPSWANYIKGVVAFYRGEVADKCSIVSFNNIFNFSNNNTHILKIKKTLQNGHLWYVHCYIRFKAH